MKLTPTFKVSDIMKDVRVKIENIDEFILNELNYVGLEFVRNARVKADFTDRTGNLRSSIGYMILKNGQIMSEDFEDSAQGTDKSTGKQKGFEFAFLKAEVTTGFVLIVVAGMEYAVYVESKGYDVITGSSLLAENDLRQAFEKLEKSLNK